MNEVSGDQSGQKGEGVVGGDEGEAVAGVHGVVGEEEVLLEEHGVQGVQDLEGGGHDDRVVHLAAGLHDVVDNHDNVQHSQAHHREPEKWNDNLYRIFREII